METNQIYEDMIKITEYKLLDKLPDLFLFQDGTRVQKKEDWEFRRAEIYKNAVELQYGTQPPKPEFLEVEPIHLGFPCGFRITTGTRANPFSFLMTVFLTEDAVNRPVVISGDHCFKYAYNREYIDAFVQNGVSLVLFDRTELAPDIAEYNIRSRSSESGVYKKAKAELEHISKKDCGGAVKRAYPQYTFGALGAWAWGYSRCVDALEQLDIVDMNCIAFTGHSRGGKAAGLAGVLDERAVIVNPNASCQGGNGSYRIQIKAITESGVEKESEPLSNIHHHFPAWLGPEMEDYIGREQELPFDAHDLKALVAPRYLLVTEAASDIMANPVGSYQTTEAAGEVFRFLGCEDHLLWHFRSGTHYHTITDVMQLVNVIRHVKDGEPLNDRFFKLPFKRPTPAYDWHCPQKK